MIWKLLLTSPAITVGVAVAYDVLRVARSTARIGKKLTKHMKDDEAHAKPSKGG